MSVAAEHTPATPVSCVGCRQALGRLLFVGTDYMSHRRYPVLACERCGLVQTAVNPAEADAAESYAGYYGKRQGAFEPVTNRLRRRRLLRVVRRSAPGTLLDVGCGRGGFLAEMRATGWRVAGVERPVPAYQDAWRAAGLDVRTEDWGRVEYPDASFDVVTFWHVFEHLPSPHAALERASRVLRADGTLVIAVPNIAGSQARLSGVRWFHLDVPRHVVHYSPASLEALLREHGFTVRRVFHYAFEYDTFGAVQSALNLCCRTQNLLFDLIMRRRSVASVLTQGNRRERVDLVLTVVLTVPLAFVAIPFCWVTSWAGQGGTVEVYAKKSTHQPYQD